MWSQLSSKYPPPWLNYFRGGDCIFDQKNLVYKYSTFCQDLNSESGTGKITLDSAFLPAPQVTTCNKIVASRQPSIFPRLHPPQVPDRPSPPPSSTQPQTTYHRPPSSMVNNVIKVTMLRRSMVPGTELCMPPEAEKFWAVFIVWERFYSPKPLFYKGFWKQNPKNFVKKCN